MNEKNKITYKVSILEFLVFLFSFFVFLFNARYVSYPDEFVNLLAGKSILNGGFPYRDFFDHHLPLAWYLAAIFLSFSFGSYTIFRLLWSLFNFVLLSFLAFYIRKKHQKIYPFYLIFLAFYPLTALYFWFHLYLADSLSVLFFSLSFWLLLLQTFFKKDLEEKSFIFILVSFLNFCLVFSSATFVYLTFFLYLWQLYLLLGDKKKIVLFIFYSILPYLVYTLYLFLTRTFFDFYFANFVYNTKLYISIPNYVKGAHFNPFKFALTLINNFWANYVVLLTYIKHLDLYLPIGVLSGLGSLTLLLILLIERLPIGIVYFFVLSFSAPRSNIQKFSETDYQASLFLVLGLISAIFSFYFLYQKKFKEVFFKDLARLTQVLLFIFGFFSFIFLGQNFYHKFFSVFTQKMPSVYNFSYVANFIDQIIEKNEYYWIGPYEPHHEFFVKKGRLPGKYPTLLPQFREDEYLKNDFLSQFKKNKPLILIFNHQASIFMTPAEEFGRFFLDWVEKNYVNLDNLKIKAKKSPSEFNIQTDLYLKKEEVSQLILRLKKGGYL